jgi:hypothetical protein
MAEIIYLKLLMKEVHYYHACFPGAEPCPFVGVSDNFLNI